MTKFYYAIQLPCDPEFDFNVGYTDKERILEAMYSNYGREFHFEERMPRNCGIPATYVIADNGDTYARVVEIYVD